MVWKVVDENMAIYDGEPGYQYKAANWIYLGKTTGRGKDDQTHKPNRSIKAVWGYPLSKNFRSLMSGRE